MAAISVERVAAPVTTTLGMDRVDYADAYQVQLGRTVTIEEVGRAFLTQPPAWAKALMAARDTVAGAVGLRTSAGAGAEENLRVGVSAGPFKVLAIEPRAIVLGEDDRHLDFRVLLGLDDKELPALTVTTLVCFHGRFGRVYFAGVRPFHRVIVRSMVAGVAEALARPSIDAGRSLRSAATARDRGREGGASDIPDGSAGT